MRPKLTHLLIATVLLAAPAAFGVASLQDGSSTDTIDAVHASQTGEAEEFETFEGEVPEDVTNGVLDLRIDHGAVEILTWEKDAYRVDVLSDGNASDGETETEFDETIEGDTISLSLVVDHQEPTGIQIAVQDERYGDAGERAIQAHVPERLVYDSVYACEGQTTSTPVDDLVSTNHEECVESNDGALFHGTINVQGQDKGEGLDVQWGMHGLEGEEAAMRVDNGDVNLSQLDFTTIEVETDNGDLNLDRIDAGGLDIETDNGDVAGQDIATDVLELETDNGQVDLAVDADEARVDTDNGDVTLKGDIATLEAASDNGDLGIVSPILSEGVIDTDNGDVVLDIQPASSGQLDLATDNGAVDVRLGHDEEIGYEVTAVTDNGDVELALVDQEDQENETEAEDDEHDPGEEQTARTSGYEDLPIQLAIDAQTDNGAIEIVEETAQIGEDEDASEGSSAGLTALQ